MAVHPGCWKTLKIGPFKYLETGVGKSAPGDGGVSGTEKQLAFFKSVKMVGGYTTKASNADKKWIYQAAG